MLDRFANDISARYDLTDVLFPGLPAVRHLVATRLRETCSSTVPRGLEIGCGAGHSAEVVLRTLPVRILHLIDANQDLLRLAKQRLGETDALRYVCMDAVDYLESQPPAEFDFCFSVYTLHNLEARQRKAFLQNLRRVLKPSGVFVCGDRFFSGEAETRLGQLEEDLRRVCDVLPSPSDSSLLRAWIVHLLDDMSPQRIQAIDTALSEYNSHGFQVSIEAAGNNIDYVLSATIGN